MRIKLLGLFLATGVIATPLAASASGPITPAPIQIDVRFQGDAAQQMRDHGEMIEFTIHYHGAPRDENDPDLDMDSIFLSRELIAVAARDQRFTVGGSIPADLLARTVDPVMTLRGDRGHFSWAKGAIGCGNHEIPLAQAMAKPVTITCRIETPFSEGYESAE